MLFFSVVQETPIHESGDVLVFLAGIGDINYLAAEIEDAFDLPENSAGNGNAPMGAWLLLKLHSSMSAQDQERIFCPVPAAAGVYIFVSPRCFFLCLL